MKRSVLALSQFGLWVVLACQIAVADQPASKERPPFHGTIFDFPDLITEADPTAFLKLEFVERTERQMFDRRLDRFASFSVFLFKAEFNDTEPIEVAVNREFETEAAARTEAEFYTKAFGRLPLMLRKEIDGLHIQAGKKLFGGGRNVLIHVDQGKEYYRDGILEETLGHEAAHALDERHARDAKWLAAQEKDQRFISTYAQENPYREDIAESVIPYLAVRHRPQRISKDQRDTIESTIPERLLYFDAFGSTGFPDASKSANEQ